MSEPVMAEHFGLSRFSVRKAMEELFEAGVIEKRVGSGTYIKNIPVKDKEYIVISTNEAFFIKQVNNSFKIITEMLKEKITAMGYIPYIHLERDSKDLPYGFTEYSRDISKNLLLPLESVAGFISLMGNENSYEVLEKNNIPIVTLLKTEGSLYPKVKINYGDYYYCFTELLKKYNLKNVHIFHYAMHDFRIDNETMFFNALDRYFQENYSYVDVPFYTYSKDITFFMEDYIKSLKEVPDAIVFLDNTLYSCCQPIFEKYSHIFKRTKIITHSNNDEIYPEEYKICRLTFSLEDFSEKAAELLEKLIKKDYPVRTTYYVDFRIINEECLA